MIISMWSAKGGVGLSVAAAAVALSMTRDHGTCLLVDLTGDQAAILGEAEPSSPGVFDWLRSEADSGESIDRLAIETGTGLSFLPPGQLGRFGADRTDKLIEALLHLDRPVVVDCGVRGTHELVGCDGSVFRDRSLLVGSLCVAGTSVLVSSACYLALRRAVRARPGWGEGVENSGPSCGLVVVTEPGRALDASDVAAVTQLKLLAQIERDPAVARCVDAGQFLRRPPRALLRSLAAVS